MKKIITAISATLFSLMLTAPFAKANHDTSKNTRNYTEDQTSPENLEFKKHADIKTDKHSSDNREDQAGQMGSERGVSNAKVTSDLQGTQLAAAKNELAPHALMIRTALRSALDEVKGLRSQLNAVPASAPESMEHIRTYERQLLSDLSLVSTHQGHIQSNISKYPEIAKSNQYRDINTSLMDVRTFSQTWDGEAGAQPSYWNNKEQAMSDLKQLETKLNTAINKTESFSSDELKVSNFG